jgi:hypothetical protein
VPWLELEWDGFCALVDEGWHGEFDASARAAWRLLLDRHEPAKVITALEQLVARGLKHRPSVSEIVAAIGTDPSRPSFAEAIQLIYGPGGVLHARPADRTWRDERERRRLFDDAAITRADGMHPLIGAFVRAQGLDHLRATNIDDPEWGPARRAGLQREFADFAGRVDDRQAAALAAGAPALEGLHRFNPLAALGMNERRELPSPAADTANTTREETPSP